nr:glycosyl hydrolase [Allostreptomyces psammosilenae]
MLLALATGAGVLAPAAPAQAATVTVGAGSYTTDVPTGVGPANSDGRAVAPKVVPGVTEPVPTNDWWSSLAFQRYAGNPYSENLYPHPLAAKAVASGLEISYPTQHQIVGDGRQYEFPHARDLTLGVPGLNSPDTRVADWSDWTVTAQWADGARTFRATLGHGLPFVYADTAGAAAQVSFVATPTVWADNGNVLGITVNGHHYALFAPTGADWTLAGTVATAPLGGRTYYSVAVLPNTSALAAYQRYAYSFVTDTRVSWDYDEAAGRLRTTYAVTTQPREGTTTGTMMALYRHQWLVADQTPTAHSYVSPRGTMRVVAGSSFSTTQRVPGVLPNMPLTSGHDTARLRELVRQVATGAPFPNAPDTYWSGKDLGRLAQVVPIADQLGDTASRDTLLGHLKSRLEEWFTAGGSAQFSYNATWDTLIGYPASYGSDAELNDHHFHYGYFVMAAATVARYDAAWAAESRWGGMLEMLVRDANNPRRDDPLFPFLRGFDPYAGHGWASGHQGFAAGNNQESSSESINFSAGLVLWGEATGDTQLRDLGVYLLTTESAAIGQYWWDVDEQVFPANYGHGTVGMVWGNGAAYSTWWTANPEEIHGINVLPITGGSLHLGAFQADIRANIAEMEAANGGPAVEWRDILWEFQAVGDPARARAAWEAGWQSYTPEQGESKAHTDSWIVALDTMGAPDPSVTASIPTAAAFTKNGTRTYVAHNFSGSAITVAFSDGRTLAVPARSTASSAGTTDPGQPGTGAGPFYLGGGGALTTTAGAAGTATIPAGDGSTSDGTPRNPLVYEARGVTATLTAGASTAFQFLVDAGTTVGLAPQVRVSYDLTGNGSFERVETYRYFATDPVVGAERYTQAVGLHSSSGSLGNLSGGTVRLEIWNALGSRPSTVGTGAGATAQQTSSLTIPFH